MSEATSMLVTAVAAELNAAGFSGPFVASPNYTPQYSIEELQELRCSVSPSTYTEIPHTRGSTEISVEIIVGIQRKLDSINSDVVGVMTDLTERILRFMRRRRLETMPAAQWQASEVSALYSPAHLSEQRVFTSVLKLQYRLIEEG